MPTRAVATHVRMPSGTPVQIERQSDNAERVLVSTTETLTPYYGWFADCDIRGCESTQLELLEEA